MSSGTDSGFAWVRTGAWTRPAWASGLFVNRWYKLCRPFGLLDGAPSSSVATEPCASAGCFAKDGQVAGALPAAGVPLVTGTLLAGSLLGALLLAAGSGMDCVPGQLDAGATSQLELGFCSALVAWP